jgi:hypothetical protein
MDNIYNTEVANTRFWWEIPKERDHSEDQGIGGKTGS